MSKLIIANWKSHKTGEEVSEWMDTFLEEDVEADIKSIDAQILIAPSFPFLSLVYSKLKPGSKNITLCAQDVSAFPFGAYTGAVTAAAVKSLGVSYAVVGHSERRRYFHEQDVEVANKVRQCVDAGIIPIVCIDEEYLVSQAAAVEDNLKSKCIVAYEPLEAIGSGQPQPVKEVERVLQVIKKAFGDVPVLYGGSVDKKTISEYLSICDGVIVGTASLAVQEFKSLLTANDIQ